MSGRPDLWWLAIVLVAVPLCIYAGLLLLLSLPSLQRNAVYAHRVHTLLFTNIDEPERWGFARNQVTPFLLKTRDGETLFGWHVLPLAVYAKYEELLQRKSVAHNEDLAETEACKILREDPDSRLVISFHGNAGHVAQGTRPAHYHAITDGSPSTHLITIDYRGFGRSSGSPTEDGMIVDAMALVDFVLNDLEIPPSRIVIVGHSLGTAATSAVAERCASKGIDFAGIVLVAGFSSLPTMLSGYAIAGYIPVLRPLVLCPPLLRWFLTLVVDKWRSTDRLAEMTRLVKIRGGRLRIFLVHAFNDWDIPCHEDDKLFAAAVRGLATEELSEPSLLEMKDERTVGRGKNAFVATWTDGNILIRQELVRRGGHNDVLPSAPVNLAVMRAFRHD